VLLVKKLRSAEPATLASSDDPLPPAATATSVAVDVAAMSIEPALIDAFVAYASVVVPRSSMTADPPIPTWFP
jgi:hypothetical protein